jgi:AcrR family transcriptional regulator
LSVDERRRQLLQAGRELFAEHGYDEISMRQIAKRAGISKPLLYHYFPSKAALFRAALEEFAAELRDRIEPDPELPPLEALARGLDAYLTWIEQNSGTWLKVVQRTGTVGEAGSFVDEFREQTLDAMLARLSPGSPPPPALRVALRGWIGYLDAAVQEWLSSGGLRRHQLRDLLIIAFGAALAAAHATGSRGASPAVAGLADVLGDEILERLERLVELLR